MRLNDRVIIVRAGDDIYDPLTGNMIPGEERREIFAARVNDMSDERMNFLFGKLKAQAYTIEFLGREPDEGSYVEIANKPYQIVRSRRLRNKSTMDVVAL